MSTFVNDKTWWSAAGLRALRTFLTTSVTYTLASGISTVHWDVMLSASTLTAIFSVLTSLYSLPELNATVPKWQALLSRTLKTFAQNALALIPTTALLLTDVSWLSILDKSAAAALGTLVLGIVSVLPETVTQTQPTQVNTVVPAA